jgi:hypothetical protein
LSIVISSSIKETTAIRRASTYNARTGEKARRRKKEEKGLTDLKLVSKVDQITEVIFFGHFHIVAAFKWNANE